MSEPSFKVDIRLIENYLFEIDFGDFGNFMTDEPEPLGNGEGPNPARLLAASVANCLCASLLFAVRKFREDPGTVTASVSGNMTRVNQRWRIERLDVAIQLGAKASDLPHLERALEQFEDFCVVTQSVRSGVPVAVTVTDKDGTVVKTG
jgi:uncharacterized OsmC-like protein